ncbi:MAG: hypothetical protein DRP66_07120 [Planctomycetota bacterium]|nr:MAG: hypothetical protein DRP66_07120 [Planctomycetota bacterium]
MNPVAAIDSIALFAGLATVVVIARGWKCRLRRDVKVLFVLIVAMVLFRNFSNVLEWCGITAALDTLEDFTEILLPVLWGFVLYAFLQGMAGDARKKLNRSLAAKNKELEDIVYIASHDLRSPLVNICGFSGELASSCRQLTALLDKITMDEEDRRQITALLKVDIPESLHFIEAGTESMERAVDGLLRLSRAGTEEIRIEKLNMNRLIDQIRQSMTFQIQKEDVSFSADDLPDCMGDRNQVSQIFSNLIDNALKYMDPGRAGEIGISGTLEDDHVVYRVHDNGIGIAAENHDKVFKIFHRLHPADSAAGEGLGLAIVSRMIQRHNGSVSIESQPGQGTTFYVHLPRP